MEEQLELPFCAAGDVVTTGTNRNPLYRLLAVIDGFAWLRAASNGAHSVVAYQNVRLPRYP